VFGSWNPSFNILEQGDETGLFPSLPKLIVPEGHFSCNNECNSPVYVFLSSLCLKTQQISFTSYKHCLHVDDYTLIFC